MDKLVIDHIKISTLIGAHPWEQQCPQTLYVDLIFETDAQYIARTDNLEKAIDYDKVVKQVLAFAKNNHFQLIETFADKLASELLAHFPIGWVQITLHKPGALQDAKSVAIQIARSQVI